MDLDTEMEIIDLRLNIKYLCQAIKDANLSISLTETAKEIENRCEEKAEYMRKKARFTRRFK